MQNVYNRMVHTCFQKCVSRFAEAELASGEQTCIDRCALKYMIVQQKINTKLRNQSAEATATPNIELEQRNTK